MRVLGDIQCMFYCNLIQLLLICQFKMVKNIFIFHIIFTERTENDYFMQFLSICYDVGCRQFMLYNPRVYVRAAVSDLR